MWMSVMYIMEVVASSASIKMAAMFVPVWMVTDQVTMEDSVLQIVCSFIIVMPKVICGNYSTILTYIQQKKYR